MGRRVRKKQCVIAFQVAIELVRWMGLQPECEDWHVAFSALDELYYTQPQSVASRWWQTVTEEEIDQFVDMWEMWQASERQLCPFCRGEVEEDGSVFCRWCFRLLEGEVVLNS